MELAPAKTKTKWLLQCLGVGILYFVGGVMIHVLEFDVDASILIWPSAGLALASVVVLGPRIWPGIVLGQMLLGLYQGRPPLVFFGAAIGASLQAVVAGRLILGKLGITPEIRTVRFALVFLLQIVVLCSLISSTFVVAAKYLAGDFVSFPSAFTIWWRWAAGDALGILVCYPFLMNWLPRAGVRPSLCKNSMECRYGTGVVLLVSLVVYDPFGLFGAGMKTFEFLPLPILMWVALRFGMRAASLNILLVAVVIVLGAAFDDSQVLSLPEVNRLIIVIGLSTLLAAASAEENEATRSALQDSERFSRRILDTTPNIIYVYDLINRRTVYSNNKVVELLGYSRAQIGEMGDKFVEKLMHPDDLVRLPGLFERWKTATDGDLLSAEYRMKGADGRWHWFQGKDAVFRRDEHGAVTEIIGNTRDITENREAQEQIRTESAFNESIVANAGEGICVCSEVPDFPHVTFSVWNQQMISITGYTMDEINRLGWYQCMYPDLEVQQRAVERMQRMRTGDNMEAEEWEIARKDGCRRQLLITTSIVLSGEGVPNVLGVMSDITSKHEATAAIERLEGLYRRAITAANAVPYMEDHATDEFTFMGEGIEQLSGYTSGEMNRRLWHKIAVTSVLQGERSGTPIDEAIRLAHEGKMNQWQCDTMIRTKSGEHRWVSDCAVEIPGPDGESTGSIGILVDITERKQTEEALRESESRFRAFLDNSPAASFMKDEDGRYVVGNKALADQLNSRVEELLGKTDAELWDAETATIFRRSDLDAIRAEGSINRVERMIAPDGTVRWLSVMKFPVQGFGDQTFVGGIALDVTEQKLAEREIRQLNQTLEDRVRERTDELKHRVEDVERLNRGMVNLLEDLQAARADADGNAAKFEVANRQLKAINQELESFSYSISHDLRAPLRHIHGFVRLLQKEAAEKLSESSRHRMEVIAESATRMGRLIDDLLEFSRSGRSELKQTRVPLDKLVRDVVADFEEATTERTIEWRIGSLPDVLGDRNLLRQVFINLVSNAVKYSSRVPHAVIEIGNEPSTEPGMTGFFIRDNGAGFDMKYADKLFGVFQRLHRQNEFEGTGIGLANVRRILHRHGAEIHADAELGKGATFHFTLPVANDVEPVGGSDPAGPTA